MTPVLSPKLHELLGAVKGGKLDSDDPAARDLLGVLKRQGLVTVERGDDGEKVTLTDTGKAALKSPVMKAEQPSGAEAEAGDGPAEAAGGQAASSGKA